MALRLVQPGAGARRLVVIAYFVADTADLLDALPKTACVLEDIDDRNGRFALPPGKGGVDALSAAVAFAQAKAGAFEPSGVVLIGWSAGCQAPRELLRAGAAPDAILALDGISGAVPPTAAQLDPWKAFAGRARAGEALFVLAHTAMGYTERLPPGQRYESTTHMAAAITGTAGDTPAPTGALSPVEGDLYVCAYPSADIDGAAHIRQQRQVMPDLLRRVVAPWLDGRGGPTPPDHEASPPPAPSEPLGVRAVAISRAELEAGVREVPPGSNTGPRIREYLAPCGLTSGAWCAAAFCWAGRQALAPGEELPHAYTAAVHTLVESARAHGIWHDQASGYVPGVGDGAVLTRDGEDPTKGGLGHVTRVSSAPDEGGEYEGIEGNHLDGWGRVRRKLSDADLRGFIELPR